MYFLTLTKHLKRARNSGAYPDINYQAAHTAQHMIKQIDDNVVFVASNKLLQVPEHQQLFADWRGCWVLSYADDSNLLKGHLPRNPRLICPGAKGQGYLQ